MKNRKALVIASVFAIAIISIAGIIKSKNAPKPEIPPDSSSVSEISDTSSSSSLDGKIEQVNVVVGFHPLPEDIMNEVYMWEKKYPGMNIGVGIYSLDGQAGYQYNETQNFNSACTIKLPYSMYVMKKCESENINIWNTNLTYNKDIHYEEDGSGEIAYTAETGDQYSIGELMYYLLQVSDNTAYSMLLDSFPLNEFYKANTEIGGQDDWQKWGSTTLEKRKNEWLALYQYLQTGSSYSEVLRNCITNTSYAYLFSNINNPPEYMHKSGWSDTPGYPAACDCAIVADSYLIIVFTQDYTTDICHFDAISGIGNAAYSYYKSRNDKMF